MDQYARYTKAEMERIKELLENLYFYSSYWGGNAPVDLDGMERDALELAEIIKVAQARKGIDATPSH